MIVAASPQQPTHPGTANSGSTPPLQIGGTHAAAVIRVTDFDSRRLQSLIDASKLADLRDSAYLDWLERHLDDATVTSAAEIGPDIVTMNSRILVTDLDSGETFDFQVAFPRAANAAAGKVSVLAPLGMAVLGRRVGQQVTWAVPGGVRRCAWTMSSLSPRERAKTSH
jgi:regulator of nucleoside diphosphate kinase